MPYKEIFPIWRRPAASAFIWSGISFRASPRSQWRKAIEKAPGCGYPGEFHVASVWPWPFWRPALWPAGLGAGRALASAATPETQAPPRPGQRAGKGRGHRPQARGRPAGGADLHHRLQPGRSRQAERQDHRGPEICQPFGLYRAHRLPPGHAEHHHPRPAQFRRALGRRQSGPGLRHRLGGLQGRRLLCPRRGPDRLAVRPGQCRRC